MNKSLISGLVALAMPSIFAAHWVQAQEVVLPNVISDWNQPSFPVENFQGYTSGFGWRWNHTDFHPGLDIAAPYGSYIHNWLRGHAISVGQDGRCGMHVVIKSGKWKATYCHMSRVQVVEGPIIPTGTVIGQVGMTGRTTGPHLHFQLQYNDQLVNPALALKAMYVAQHQRTAAKITKVALKSLSVPISPY